MKKTLKLILSGLLLVPMMAAGVLSLSGVVSADCDPSNGGLQSGIECTSDDPDNESVLFAADGQSGIFNKIINTALFIIGALAVVMLIYGGIRYTVSAGDAKHVESAKNTIMYAIIGIVVAILAYAIVNFVIARLIGS